MIMKVKLIIKIIIKKNNNIIHKTAIIKKIINIKKIMMEVILKTKAITEIQEFSAENLKQYLGKNDNKNNKKKQ